MIKGYLFIKDGKRLVNIPIYDTDLVIEMELINQPKNDLYIYSPPNKVKAGKPTPRNY